MTGAQTSATLGGHNCTRPDPLSAAAGAQPPRIAAHRPSRSAKRPVCLSLHGSIHALPIERLASTGRRTHACGHRHRQGKQPWPQNSGKGTLFSSRHGAPIASGHLLKARTLCKCSAGPCKCKATSTYGSQCLHDNLHNNDPFFDPPCTSVVLPRRPVSNYIMHQQRPS